MSFNIRYGTADDGPNSWSHRQEMVRDTVCQAAPDVLGVQEALDFQVDYLKQQLDAYKVVGVGREDGARRGEFAAIFYHKERFGLVEDGHFWLSETPDVPGSMAWGTSQTRMVTWCRLRNRQRAAPTESGSRGEPLADGSLPATLVVFNTHFDQRSAEARIESARLLRSHIDHLIPNQPVIVTGDFNATEDESVYQTLLYGGQSGPVLTDAYRAVHFKHDGQELTRHAFRFDRFGSRIDWILHSQHFKTDQAAIVRNRFDGRYPSDHYPVTATLHLAVTDGR